MSKGGKVTPELSVRVQVPAEQKPWSCSEKEAIVRRKLRPEWEKD